MFSNQAEFSQWTALSRVVWLALLCGLAGLTAPDVRAADVSAPQAPWYRTKLVGIEVGPTGANLQDPVYMSQANGKRIVDCLRLAHADYGVVFMKDMEFAYYNSKVAAKCPGLGSRDLLGECLDEAKKHHLPIIAYCQVQYDSSSWRAHPDWRMKGVDGKDLDGRLCYNSGYLEFIKQVLGEMMNYPIVGFHVDMLDFGFGPPVGCFCPRCRELFRKKYNADMPRGITWDDNWDHMLQFRCDSNTHFCQEVQDFVHARRPELSVDFNYHGYPPFSWLPGEKPLQHAANGDFVTCEPLPWVFGHNMPSFLSLFLQGAGPRDPGGRHVAGNAGLPRLSHPSRGGIDLGSLHLLCPRRAMHDCRQAQ